MQIRRENIRGGIRASTLLTTTPHRIDYSMNSIYSAVAVMTSALAA